VIIAKCGSILIICEQVVKIHVSSVQSFLYLRVFTSELLFTLRKEARAAPSGRLMPLWVR